MRPLTAAEIIQLWETSCCLHPIDQALSMLRVVLPHQGRDELAALPLGRRDIFLLALRRMTFGDALPAQCRCPCCGETVEFELSCSDLERETVEAKEQMFSRDGYTMHIRPLNSFDLAAAAEENTLLRAREILLQRCTSNIRYQGSLIGIANLPPDIANTMSQSTLEADPQAEKLLELGCPSCCHQWLTMLDIGHILWLEISARAQRLLREIHLLAQAYGWHEQEIINLTPARRAAYVQMVTA